MKNQNEIFHSLGIIYSDNARNGLTHDFFAAILNGFKNEAEEHGYEIHFINTTYKNVDFTYLDIIRAKNIDGVMVLCADYSDPHVKEVIESGLPIVTIDEAIDGVVSVLSDNEKGIRELVEYLISQGHRKIAYIHGDINTVTGKRIDAFKNVCEEHGITVPAEYIASSHFRDIDRTTYLTEELLRLPDPPTCIIFPDDYAAIGGINVIHARGLFIPDDISVAGYDGLDIISRFEPRITTVRQDMNLMGTTAASKLIDFVENGMGEDLSDIIIPVELSKGRTVKQVFY